MWSVLMRSIIPVISILCGLWLSATATSAERVLHRGGIGDPETLDPQATGSGTEGTLMTDLFSGLLTPGPAGDISSAVR